jgi:methyl-accepting chemotaxis protein
VVSVRDITGIVGEIATTSAQQNAGIEQVNHAVSMLNAVTHKNAALVEEASFTAEAMNEQASSLVEVVGTFRFAPG